MPAAATEFTTFAKQALDAKPDLLFVAWAGTTAPAMWQALDQQGVLASTTVVTGLDIRASWPTFGAAGTKISFLAHYFDGAADNAGRRRAEARRWAAPSTCSTRTASPPPRWSCTRSRRAATDVDAMITALEGWSFDGVKGKTTVRAADHALLQPMFQAKLTGSGTDLKAELVKALSRRRTSPRRRSPFKA